MFDFEKVDQEQSQSLIKQGINSYHAIALLGAGRSIRRNPLSSRASIPTIADEFYTFVSDSRNPLSSRASIPTAPKIVSQSNQIVKVLRPNF